MICRCSYCGKEYDTPVDRAKCEIECDKEIKAKVEQEKHNKLKAEKGKRTEELSKAYDEYKIACQKAKEKYMTVVEQYYKDYGENSYINLITDNFVSSIYNHMKDILKEN